MSEFEILEVPIRGMDCAECTRHVQTSLSQLPGVESSEVFLASEKAVLRLDSSKVDMGQIREAVLEAGYEMDAEIDTEADKDDAEGG